MGGNWNVVQDIEKDTFNIIHDKHKLAREMIEKIMEDMDLIDIWRVYYPENKTYTWRRKNPIKQSRLDYFLVSSELSTIVSDTNIFPGYKTDHSAIQLSCINEENKRGKDT